MEQGTIHNVAKLSQKLKLKLQLLAEMVIIVKIVCLYE